MRQEVVGLQVDVLHVHRVFYSLYKLIAYLYGKVVILKV